MTVSRATKVCTIPLLMCLVSCGGGGYNPISGGGNGGGGNGGGGIGGGGSFPSPQITLLTPSQINTYAAASFTFLVHGSNFAQNSTVGINGSPAGNTVFQDSTSLLAFPGRNQIAAPGKYSISVTGNTGQSNAMPLTVYAPQQGPQPFLALPGYYTGSQSGSLAIATGDLNGDGRDDVVVAAGPSSTGIAVLLGQSDGTLGTPQYIGPGADALVVGDVNGDGFPDIVAGVSLAGNNPPTCSIIVYLNDGSGNFTAGATENFNGGFPNPMVLADLRGTGRNDLLLAVNNPDTLYLFPNQGNGTFGQPITLGSLGPEQWFGVADFNGDGLPDIAYEGVNVSTGNENTHLLINQGGGAFNDIVPMALANTGGIFAIGDFNHDGRPDLAIQIAKQQVPIPLETFLNTGNNSFTLVSTTYLSAGLNIYSPFHFLVGDFDNDGFLDIAAENGIGTQIASAVFLWGDGTGNFTPQEVGGPSGFSFATGDINGDGKPDLVIPDTNLVATVILGQSGRSFPQPTILHPPMANSVVIGDVNGDGFPDLLFVGDNQTPSTIFLNDGHGNFTLAGRVSLIGNGNGEELVDLNRSGKADLIGFSVTTSGGEAIVIFPGTGDPNYPSSPIAVPIPLAIGTCIGAPIVDLDGDGLPDIVCDNQIGWNQGNYQFAFTPLTTNGVLAIGDVNNDGKPDLITVNGTFLNQGNKQFRNIPQNGLTANYGNVLVLGDFNHDGKTDAAFTDPFSGDTIEVAYGNGDGTFYLESTLATTEAFPFGNVIGLVGGDFNGDGWDDLVAPMLIGTHVLVLTNDEHGQFQNSYFANGFLTQYVWKADLNMDGRPDLILLPGTPTDTVEIVFSH